jgi:pimeloyl-ACP methyl ester carboxylesterase
MDARTQHLHHATSPDGTQIAGRVHGRGPSLVLVHGGISDGDMAWAATLPYLSQNFTCFLANTRGRGQSADSPDHSPGRLVDDIIAFAESIGEPVFIAGLSSGAAQALAVAARSDAISAVAAWEPANFRSGPLRGQG